MNWLRSIVQGITSAILNWGQGQAEKPKAMQDANTPKDIADSNSAAYQQWLRDKQSDGH
jgi:hypothetical protein